MSRNVSMFLRISKLANKLEDKTKSERKSQLLKSKGFNGYKPSGSANLCLTTYEVCFSIPEDLAVSSASNFSNSPTLKTPRTIVQKSFSRYIFFWTYNRMIRKDSYSCFSRIFFNSAFK